MIVEHVRVLADCALSGPTLKAVLCHAGDEVDILGGAYTDKMVDWGLVERIAEVVSFDPAAHDPNESEHHDEEVRSNDPTARLSAVQPAQRPPRKRSGSKGKTHASE